MVDRFAVLYRACGRYRVETRQFLVGESNGVKQGRFTRFRTSLERVYTLTIYAFPAGKIWNISRGSLRNTNTAPETPPFHRTPVINEYQT